MADLIERSAADEIADVRMDRPHVVILGAGASRAACPDGDKAGRPLPLMADFASCLGIEAQLAQWGIDPADNFEDVYSMLHEAGETDKLARLNQVVESYFEHLELPDHPTIYDHLILSLRDQDIIASFNWDPLLIQAYRRNAGRLGLPMLAFLHGNILSGYCETDSVVGVAGALCKHCGLPYRRTPLLYPVRHKNYADDPAIAAAWSLLKWGFENAFMFTIFGYSGPKTDQEAIDAMRSAWGLTADRNMEQTAFITLQSSDDVRAAWRDFIHSHHYEVQADFYESWIARHPRRTGEAYLAQFVEAQFIADNPIPRDAGFETLRSWFDRFHPAEEAASLKR